MSAKQDDFRSPTADAQVPYLKQRRRRLGRDAFCVVGHETEALHQRPAVRGWRGATSRSCNHALDALRMRCARNSVTDELQRLAAADGLDLEAIGVEQEGAVERLRILRARARSAGVLPAAG
jgi:hypothetical protein